MIKRTVQVMIAVALTAMGLVVAGAPADATVTKYKKCADLNAVYPHGVGLKGAKDKVRAGTKPVTTFTVNAAVYTANKPKLDRDKDGIACEKK